MVKNPPPAIQDTWIQSLCQEDSLEKGMDIHSSILAWRIPWTEKPSGLQSMGSKRLRQDRATNTLIRISCSLPSPLSSATQILPRNWYVFTVWWRQHMLTKVSLGEQENKQLSEKFWSLVFCVLSCSDNPDENGDSPKLSQNCLNFLLC